jgi:diguanylate cyclase (GGDEF)-like protein
MDLAAFPESPYAAELQRGVMNRRFAPPLESQYLRDRLLQNRTLIRVACVLAAVLAILRTLEQVIGGTWSGLFLIDLGLIIAGSVALATLAWSPDFERLYLRRARIIVPIRNSIVAAHIAAAAAQGHLEMLMVLPITLLGPFFFLGFRFRPALMTCVLTMSAYVTAATFFDLSHPIALRSYALLLAALIACVVAARKVERALRVSFLEGRFITELAQRDPLTGMRNRRVFDEQLDLLWQRAVKANCAIAILLIDIDHFKAYNDRYGHQAGDRTLCRVAQTVQSFVRRPGDILARYGGEEFAAILYDTDADRAQEVADRIRRAVRELAIEHRESRTSSLVTISVGVAAIEPTADRNAGGALQLADQALYEAKVRGRNRVELMDGKQHDLMVTGVFTIACSSSQISGSQRGGSKLGG